MEKVRTRSLFGSLVLFATAVSLHAQMPATEIAVPAGPQGPGTQESPADFGTKINILQIPASAFQPRCSALAYNYNGSGYMSVTNNPCNFASEVMWAPVTLPTGALVQFLDLYYDDTDAANDITAVLRATSNVGGLSNVTTVSSSGSAGVGYASSSLVSYLVNNNVQYDVDGRTLQVLLLIPNASVALKFQGVDIWWSRPVSPAPAVATFNDMPTDNPQFQFVEALVRSGVTAGCGGGNYCPNNPVTRGQMAVFLAKALGLSWFDSSGVFVTPPPK